MRRWYNVTVLYQRRPYNKHLIADSVSVFYSYIKLHLFYKYKAAEWWKSLKPSVVPQLLRILNFPESSISRTTSGDTHSFLENGAWLTSAFPSHRAVLLYCVPYLIPFDPGRLYGVKRVRRLGPNAEFPPEQRQSASCGKLPCGRLILRWSAAVQKFNF